jgi:hypothetical protein
MARKRKILLSVVLVLALGFTGLYVSGPGQTFRDLWKHNIIQSLLSKPPERNYEPGRRENLKALYVAIMLYHDSEGQWPTSSGWMDAIKSHLRASDMSETEADKKLVRPNLTNPTAGEYGYAMNDAASGKYKGDIKDRTTPLIFESDDLKWNAHGNPAGKQGFGITVAGEILNLK